MSEVVVQTSQLGSPNQKVVRCWILATDLLLNGSQQPRRETTGWIPRQT